MYRPIRITHGLAIVALAFSGLALSPAALASTLVQTRSRDVSYSDLNLATRGGDKALLKRINHAAVEACGGYPTGLKWSTVAKAVGTLPFRHPVRTST